MRIYRLAVYLKLYDFIYMHMPTDCICISVCCVHGISCLLDQCETSWLVHLRLCVERDVHPSEEEIPVGTNLLHHHIQMGSVVLPTQSQFDVTEGPQDFPELCCRVQGFYSPGLQLPLTLNWFCAAWPWFTVTEEAVTELWESVNWSCAR